MIVHALTVCVSGLGSICHAHCGLDFCSRPVTCVQQGDSRIKGHHCLVWDLRLAQPEPGMPTHFVPHPRVAPVLTLRLANEFGRSTTSCDFEAAQKVASQSHMAKADFAAGIHPRAGHTSARSDCLWSSMRWPLLIQQGQKRNQGPGTPPEHLILFRSLLRWFSEPGVGGVCWPRFLPEKGCSLP